MILIKVIVIDFYLKGCIYRSQEGFNKLCREEQPDYENDNEAIHKINKYLLKEGGEPCSCCISAFHVLQLFPDSSDIESNPCNGSGDYRSCVEFGRNSKSHKLTRNYKSKVI